jgi:adenylate cyclase
MLGGNLTLLTLLKFWREERQKKFYHRAFSHYVSPAVVQQIAASPDKLTLVGEEKEVSILFCDIRDFTTISETLLPTQVSEILKVYFTPMTRTILAHMGTMDKFIGDAVMAFWNAPLDTAAHQRLAVRTALEMLERLVELNPGLVRDFGVEIKVGIGLHCGSVRVGNMGSEDLFDYTIIGDSVNLASRIEGLTKSYGLPLLVTDSIRSACGDEFFFLELDTVRVKGRSEPVTVYAPYSGETARKIAEELEAFTKGLGLYKEEDFDAAARLFSRLCEAHPGHKLYAVYLERALALAKDPPPPGWNGIYPGT